MEHSMPFTSKSKDRMFGAQDWAQSKAIYFTTGVVQSAFDGLTLKPGTGLTTVLSTGAACVEGHDYWSDAPLTLEHSVTLSKDRTDLVCLRMDALEARNIVAVVKEGTTTATQTDDLYELPLYEVTVRAKADTIAAADIQDVRPFSALYPLPPYYPNGKLPELLWRYCLFPMSLTDAERAEVERSEQFMQIADKAATQYAKIGDSFLRRKFATNMYDIKRATPLKEKGILPDVPEHIAQNVYPRYEQSVVKTKLSGGFYLYVVTQYRRTDSNNTDINSLKSTAILYDVNTKKKCGELALPVFAYSASSFDLFSEVASFDKTTAIIICPYQYSGSTTYKQVWAVEYGSFGLRKVAQYMGASLTPFCRSHRTGIPCSEYDEPKLFFFKDIYSSGDVCVCAYTKSTKTFTESTNRFSNYGNNYGGAISKNVVIRNGYMYYIVYETYNYSSSNRNAYFRLVRMSESGGSNIYTSASNSSSFFSNVSDETFIRALSSDVLLIANLTSRGSDPANSGYLLITVGAALWSISGNKKIAEIALCDAHDSSFSSLELTSDPSSIYLIYKASATKCIRANKQTNALSLVDYDMSNLNLMCSTAGLPKIAAMSSSGSGQMQVLQVNSETIKLENITSVDTLKNPTSICLNLRNGDRLYTTDYMGVYPEMEISPYIEVAPAGISYYAYEVTDV